MLINCPRCGFSQPKDRYCANCGVDMETYKPKPTSAVKKLLANPIFHVSIIAAIVIASVVVIKQRQKEELKSRIEFLKAGPMMVERQSSPTTAQTEISPTADAQASIANTPETAPSASAEAASAGAEPPAPPVSASTLAAASAARSADPSVRGTANNTLKMTVTYLEVDRRVLGQWIEEAKNTGQQRIFEGVTMGPLLQVSTKLSAGTQGVKVLQNLERNLDPSNPSQEWFVGTHQGVDLESQMGFFSSLVLSEWREGLIRGDIEVQRAFRNPQDATRVIERVSFGSPFELSAGSGYMMSGLLPVNYITPLPDAANPDPYLQIFKSESFRNRQTEFTLVIQFATSRP